MSLISVNPGRLDKRVLLQMEVNTQASDGSVETAWLSVIRVWASWFPTASREFTAAQSLHAEATGLFRIRHRAIIDTKWRLVHGDDVFDVIGTHEIGRRQYLDLVVKNLNGSPGSSLDAEMLEDGTPVLLEDGGLQLLEPVA